MNDSAHQTFHRHQLHVDDTGGPASTCAPSLPGACRPSLTGLMSLFEQVGYRLFAHDRRGSGRSNAPIKDYASKLPDRRSAHTSEPTPATVTNLGRFTSRRWTILREPQEKRTS